MEANVTLTITQPAARGPVYIAYVAKTTDGSSFTASLYKWKCYIWNSTEQILTLTPDVDNSQHTDPINLALTPSGASGTYVWNTSADITDPLYSSLAKIYVTAIDTSGITETFTSGTFALDMRYTVATAYTTNITGYLSETIRFLYDRTKSGVGYDPAVTPTVSHVYDAGGTEYAVSPPDAMTKEATGAYYSDFVVPATFAVGQCSYTVLDGTTSTTFYMTIRKPETGTHYHSDECNVSGHIIGVAGNVYADYNVIVMVDGPYYRSNNLQWPDFATETFTTDADGYLEMHLPRNTHMIIKIDGYKTGRVLVPNLPIASIADLL